MKELTEIYERMGISPAVYQYGEAAIARLKDRFEEIEGGELDAAGKY